MDAGILRSVRSATAAQPTARSIRAARSGLGLSLLDLARSAGVSVTCIGRVERGDTREADRPALGKVRLALEAAGVEFFESDGAAGVLFRPLQRRA